MRARFQFARRATLALPLALWLLPGCGQDARGAGTVDVRIYGEAFIEDGITASEMDDQWAIEFSRFEVELRDIFVAGSALGAPDAIDISKRSNGQGFQIGTLTIDAGVYDEPSFTIASVEVDGLAAQGDLIKTFSWVFDSATHYWRCDTTTEVEKNSRATFQIAVHADHFFYDSLVAEEPRLLFQPLADADADRDDKITEAELAAADIGAYDPGNEDIDDLWSWLIAQSRTLGHVDGEGHCEATVVD